MKKIILIYFLMLVGLFNVQAQLDCTNKTITGLYTIPYTKTLQWIVTSGVTTIPIGANVTLDGNPATNGFVTMNPGFETSPNSIFLAIVLSPCEAAPLPIKLINFDAKAQENHVQLNWATSSESNSQGFEIERGENGKEFSKIGYVKSEANNDKSNEKLAYNFYDHTSSSVVGGLLYYRLKQLDLDGKFEYSQIKSVKMETLESIKIYPNPVADFLSIEGSNLSQIKSIELLDTKGSSIYKSNFAENKIDMNNTSPGIYFLKIEKMDGKVEVRKVLKN
jgi:glucuronoarabinoxylan endo-1,4-beta-xylanase